MKVDFTFHLLEIFLTGKVDNEVVFVDFESDPVFPRLAADPTKVSNYIRLRIMDEITSILTT